MKKKIVLRRLGSVSLVASMLFQSLPAYSACETPGDMQNFTSQVENLAKVAPGFDDCSDVISQGEETQVVSESYGIASDFINGKISEQQRDQKLAEISQKLNPKNDPRKKGAINLEMAFTQNLAAQNFLADRSGKGNSNPQSMGRALGLMGMPKDQINGLLAKTAKIKAGKFDSEREEVIEKTWDSFDESRQRFEELSKKLDDTWGNYQARKESFGSWSADKTLVTGKALGKTDVEKQRDLAFQKMQNDLNEIHSKSGMSDAAFVAFQKQLQDLKGKTDAELDKGLRSLNWTAKNIRFTGYGAAAAGVGAGAVYTLGGEISWPATAIGVGVAAGYNIVKSGIDAGVDAAHGRKFNCSFLEGVKGNLPSTILFSGVGAAFGAVGGVASETSQALTHFYKVAKVAGIGSLMKVSASDFMQCGKDPEYCSKAWGHLILNAATGGLLAKGSFGGLAAPKVEGPVPASAPIAEAAPVQPHSMFDLESKLGGQFENLTWDNLVNNVKAFSANPLQAVKGYVAEAANNLVTIKNAAGEAIEDGSFGHEVGSGEGRGKQILAAAAVMTGLGAALYEYKPAPKLVAPAKEEVTLYAPELPKTPPFKPNSDLQVKRSGGGGGGMKAPKPAPQAKSPKVEETPEIKPVVERLDKPKLQMDIPTPKVVAMNMNTKAPVIGTLDGPKITLISSGPGVGGGAGSGKGTGEGAGNGSGVGNGNGGGAGGGNNAAGSGNRPVSLIGTMPSAPYTQPAKDHDISGYVILHLTVGKNGSPASVTLAQNDLHDKDGNAAANDYGLIANAIALGRSLRFNAALKNNQPVDSQGNVRVNFTAY